jgi:serine/threonine-protein kinase
VESGRWAALGRRVGARALRLLGYASYGAGLLFLFFATAYFAFNFFVRSGVTRAPDLTGLSRDDAIATLESHGLEWADSPGEGRYSETVPIDHVVTQQPRAGSLVKRGSRVAVALSLGAQRIAVPDVEGLALAAAQSAVADAGLEVGHALAVYTEEGRAGTVFEQRPAAASTVPRDTKVDLLVAHANRDPVYVMPDLVYRDYGSVRHFFELRGFRVGQPRFEPYEGISEGVILRQDPAPGHPLSRRRVIDLVVASASVPAQ